MVLMTSSARRAMYPRRRRVRSTQMSKLLGRKLKQRRHTPHRTIKSEAGIPATAPGEELPEEEIAGFMDDDHRHAIIAQHAYYLSERRGFEPGHELDDWLSAERDIEQLSDSPRIESPTLCGE